MKLRALPSHIMKLVSQKKKNKKKKKLPTLLKNKRALFGYRGSRPAIELDSATSFSTSKKFPLVGKAGG